MPDPYLEGVDLMLLEISLSNVLLMIAPAFSLFFSWGNALSPLS